MSFMDGITVNFSYHNIGAAQCWHKYLESFEMRKIIYQQFDDFAEMTKLNDLVTVMRTLTPA